MKRERRTTRARWFLTSSADVDNIFSVWETNRHKAISVRLDHAWSGDTTGPPGHILKGWDLGMWRALSLEQCSWDPEYIGTELTPVHTFIRFTKKILNLPNQGTYDDWCNDYPPYHMRCYEGGECMYFLRTSNLVKNQPMVLSTTEMMGENTYNTPDWYATPGGIPVQVGDNIKCMLITSVRGYGPIELTVRPDDNDPVSYNNHYKHLRALNTDSREYTDPPLNGSKYTESGSTLLINCENQFKISPPKDNVDQLMLCVAWNNYTYKEIKAMVNKI
jgi:hypothetical protein